MKNFRGFLRSNDELREKWEKNFQEIENSETPDEWNTFTDGVLTAHVRRVDGYGGEGMGDDYWLVFEVTCENIVTYYKLEGWYASYEGANFDDEFDLVEVEKVPVQKYEWKDLKKPS